MARRKLSVPRPSRQHVTYQRPLPTGTFIFIIMVVTFAALVGWQGYVESSEVALSPGGMSLALQVAAFLFVFVILLFILSIFINLRLRKLQNQKR